MTIIRIHQLIYVQITHVSLFQISFHFRQNMANFAVKMGGEPVTSSVAASRLNYSLAQYIHRNEQAIKDKVLNNKA